MRSDGCSGEGPNRFSISSAVGSIRYVSSTHRSGLSNPWSTCGHVLPSCSRVGWHPRSEVTYFLYLMSVYISQERTPRDSRHMPTVAAQLALPWHMCISWISLLRAFGAVAQDPCSNVTVRDGLLRCP